MQICIKRHGEFVDAEEHEVYVNELLLFVSFKFTWFEFQCGLDHR